MFIINNHLLVITTITKQITIKTKTTKTITTKTITTKTIQTIKSSQHQSNK